MANEEHLAILRLGLDEWNEWRRTNGGVRPDLREADLCEMELSGANLSRVYLNQAYLSEVNLSGAQLTGAQLDGADLIGAYLIGAQLGGARIVGANLSRANFSAADLSWADLSKARLGGTKLSGANLSGANLAGANFKAARVAQTLFANVDLSEAEGLEAVIHDGPSTLGMDTIYISKGRIPEAFLRGCGVPIEVIPVMYSVVAAGAVASYSCFISYSTGDQGFAEHLYADLQGKNVRCWLAPEGIRSGRKLNEQIDDAICYHHKLVLILSGNNMGSEWVKTEIRRARRIEARAGRRKLFPVSLVPFDAIRTWEAYDAVIDMDVAAEVREHMVPDFSEWQDDDAYQWAFERLLRDMKTE
jgi:uncharacterized protein YjbI with pentapeptide repeats